MKATSFLMVFFLTSCASYHGTTPKPEVVQVEKKVKKEVKEDTLSIWVSVLNIFSSTLQILASK